MPRTRGVFNRILFEGTVASLSAVSTALTMVWPEWLEAFGLDPDHGDGSLEWAMAGALLLVTLVMTARVGLLAWAGSTRRAPTSP